MKLLKALIGMLAVALFTTAAVAGDETGGKEHSKAAKFDKLDSNKDGRVSKTEAQTEETLSAQFASVDQDSDGYVSKSEFTAMAQAEQPSQGERSPQRQSDYSREPGGE